MSARVLAAATAAILLAACGSKSSSEPPPTGPDIRYTGATTDVALTSTSDKNAIASTAAGLAQGVASSPIPSSGGAPGQPGGGSAVALVMGGQTPHRTASVREAMLLAQDAFHRRDLALASGAYATGSASCAAGGSVSIATVKQSETRATPGDFVQVSFSGCKDAQGDTAWGSFRMTINEATANEFVTEARSITTSEAFGLSLVFHDYSMFTASGPWVGMDGGLDVSFVATVDTVAGGTGSLEFTVSGAELVSASGPAAGVVTGGTRLTALANGDGKFHEQGRELYSGIGTANAEKAESQWDLDAKVCTLQFMGCLNILTDPTFAKRELPAHPYPYAGALTVYDHDGDYIKVTAVNEDTGEARLDWSIDGATGTATTTWN
jgi:hypothetical protein